MGPFDQRYLPPGGVDESSEYFKSNPEARKLMAVSRRWNMRWSVFLDSLVQEWFLQDVLDELGYDQWKSDDDHERCPNCRVHPDEMLRDSGKPAGNRAIVEHYVDECRSCIIREALAEDEMQDQDGKAIPGRVMRTRINPYYTEQAVTPRE